MLAPCGDNVRVNLATSLKDSDDGHFIFHPAFCNHALAPLRMHESSRATNKGFVYFDFAVRAAQFHKVLVVHRKSNAVHHEPSRLLRNAQSACDFIGTDAIFAVHNQPHRNHPLIHAERGILKDGSDFDGELFFASLAEPNSARRDERVLRRFAARASDFACRPAQRHRIVESLLRVREKGHCVLQRLGKLGFVCHA